MQIDAIFQVRTNSSRLPNKVFETILGKSLLWHVVQRVKTSSKVSRVILATTTNSRDERVVGFAKENNLLWFCGNEDDVLDRFYQTAKKYNSDIIVRVTPDDPFRDPQLIDQFLGHLLANKGELDYISNTIEPTYPEGIDLEVFTFEALEKAWKESTKLSEREHVTPYIWKHPNKFKIKNVKYKDDLSNLRWTVDYPQDLEFVRQVYQRLYPIKKIFLLQDILDLLRKEPELSKINQGIAYHEGYAKSLEKDNLKKG